MDKVPDREVDIAADEAAGRDMAEAEQPAAEQAPPVTRARSAGRATPLAGFHPGPAIKEHPKFPDSIAAAWLRGSAQGPERELNMVWEALQTRSAYTRQNIGSLLT